MGDDAPFIHPTASVEEGAGVGARTRVWALSHIRRGARVGADCIVGEGVFIDLEVSVGARCKLQNGAQLFHGALLEEEVFIGPAACLTNDRYPRAATPDGRLKTTEDWTVSGVTVRRGAAVGAHAVVVGGVTLGAWCMAGSGAVVTRDVLDHALVAGNPARQLGWVCRCGRRLAESLRCSCGLVYRELPTGLELRADTHARQQL